MKTFELSWPRCGHGMVVVTERDGDGPAITMIEWVVDSSTTLRHARATERERINRISGAQDKVLETPQAECSACREAGHGRRHLRSGEMVSRHAPSGALPAK